ncbi:hypothetical protein K431DRAFT_617 [Polychaeton citri CBS 116435]|uniref:Uncharacterized protein n=1 Tax=Polychaeton citri CBS 116435 TaxID=1314669 RepID=A0A9P4QJJ8_9PEZI|nr:hypothetical protein K431DRAFT_617 [Polychaeton citri CBS 116435]
MPLLMGFGVAILSKDLGQFADGFAGGSSNSNSGHPFTSGRKVWSSLCVCSGLGYVLQSKSINVRRNMAKDTLKGPKIVWETFGRTAFSILRMCVLN